MDTQFMCWFALQWANSCSITMLLPIFQFWSFNNHFRSFIASPSAPTRSAARGRDVKRKKKCKISRMKVCENPISQIIRFFVPTKMSMSWTMFRNVCLIKLLAIGRIFRPTKHADASKASITIQSGQCHNVRHIPPKHPEPLWSTDWSTFWWNSSFPAHSSLASSRTHTHTPNPRALVSESPKCITA